MSQTDLHIHSTASDGRVTPEEIVGQAAARSMTTIALADHDTIDGVAQARAAAKQYKNLTVIPAVEISTDIPHGELHVLGYFIDHTDAAFKARLDHFRNSRRERAQKMVAKLNKLGLDVAWERVQEIAGESNIGRPHIAQAMLEKGYIASFKQAFTDYLGRDAPAYVEREKMTPEQTMTLINGAGGLPVLAHPLTLDNPEAMVKELVPYGLAGLEIYYNGYTATDIEGLRRLVQRYGLIATGGSDFHGIDDTETPLGGADVPPEVVAGLMARAGAARIARLG